MATSFGRSCAHTATLSAPDPAAGHHWPMPPLETPGHSQASLAQSLVGSLLLSPGFRGIQNFVCALQESVSPVLCKFCNQISIHTSNLFICVSVFYFYFSQFWFIFTLITLNSFQVDCLFPCHLFGLVGFYCVLSSAACFSVFSCHLTYYVWRLLSSAWKVLIPLYCEFCPPWMGLDHCLVKFSLLANLCLCSGRWSWILSLWRAVPCTVM